MSTERLEHCQNAENTEEDYIEEEEEEEENESQDLGSLEQSNHQQSKSGADLSPPTTKPRNLEDKQCSNHHHQQLNPSRYVNVDPHQTLDSLIEENEEDEEALLHEQQLAEEPPDYEKLSEFLRHLLQIERANNERRRQNNISLQRYLQQLQTDYLRQQQDLVEALELSHKIKAHKDSQIALVEETIKEKDQLIEQLRANLASLDDTKLRQEFQETLDKQKRLAQVEQDQLRNQIQSVEQQLVRERVNNSQLLQQFQEKLDDQLKLHERELANLQSRLDRSQSELERIVGEPQNLVIKALREDKCKLEGQVDELNLVLDDSKNKYECLRKRIELLVAEQEQTNRTNQEELDRIQQQYLEEKHQVSELKLELDDRNEVVQVLQFNLQRSEKRVKNLLGALKGKESAYREMISQLELKQEQELEASKVTVRDLERRLIEVTSELDRKQNELVRLQLEHENQLDSLRNDRDERINKLILEKSKCDKELQGAEIKLARECELTSEKSKQIDQLHKEVKQFKDESKRLSIELTQKEAKLYAKTQELQKLLEQTAQSESNGQEDVRDKQQLTFELDEARRHSKRLERSLEELRASNDRLNMKLRIAESNITKMSSAINREHSKMMHEYEKKLDQLRLEHFAFDKNKLRYKRYGYKLKKYCEHLKVVHEHLCNPSVCGYIISPIRDSSSSSKSRATCGRSKSSTTTSRRNSTTDDDSMANYYYESGEMSDCGTEYLFDGMNEHTANSNNSGCKQPTKATAATREEAKVPGDQKSQPHAPFTRGPCRKSLHGGGGGFTIKRASTNKMSATTTTTASKVARKSLGFTNSGTTHTTTTTTTKQQPPPPPGSRTPLGSNKSLANVQRKGPLQSSTPTSHIYSDLNEQQQQQEHNYYYIAENSLNEAWNTTNGSTTSGKSQLRSAVI